MSQKHLYDCEGISYSSARTNAKELCTVSFDKRCRWQTIMGAGKSEVFNRRQVKASVQENSRCTCPQSKPECKSVDDILAAHWTFGIWLAEQIGILHFDICPDRLYKYNWRISAKSKYSLIVQLATHSYPEI